jgi:hypothetical protein
MFITLQHNVMRNITLQIPDTFEILHKKDAIAIHYSLMMGDAGQERLQRGARMSS